MTDTTWVQILLFVLALFILLPSELSAQPSPFETYDLEKSSEPEPSEPPARAAQAPKPVDSSAGDIEAFQAHSRLAGQWTVGATGAFNLALSQNSLLEGGEARNSTFFARVSPTLGYFLTDRLELGLGVGLFFQRLQRETAASTVRNYWFELTGGYHIPLSARLTLLPSLGLGAYFGTSNREVEGAATMTSSIDELTRTSGLTGALYLGLEYAIGPNVALDFNVHTIGLLGRERIKSEDTVLKARSLNSGVGLGFKYFF